MAKHVKAALTAAFVIFVVATTGRVDIAFSVFGLGGAASLAVFTFGTTLLSSVIGGMTSKGLNATSGNFGSKFATRAPTAPRQLIYGQCRVGGTIVHMETTGTDNFLLHAVVVLSGHEIESLESVRLNDVDLTTTTSTISGSTVHTVTNSEFSNTENENKYDSNGRLVRFSFEDGSQTAANGYAVAQSSLISSDKFLDCAYVYIQIVFDPEKFGGGMPNMSFVVKGKKVFDPRDSSTAWSDNPALCIRDYITDTTYGLKALSAEINDTTNAGGVAAAANACDVAVTLADGSSTEKKYTANGFTNFGASGNGVIEGLLSAMAGKMSYTNGQFNIFAGTTQTPSLTITDDNLLAPVNVSTNSGSGELYNTVKPLYIDSTNNYIAADAPVYQDSTFLTEDTPNGTANDKPNYVKQMEKQLPFTVTHTMAQRIGRLALKNQRLSTSLSCLVDLSFMKLQPADWVYVTNERLGYTQKIFEVISVNMEVMQTDETPTLGVRLALKETAASTFAFATSDYQANIAAGSNLASGGFQLAAPTSLSVATDSTDVDSFNFTSATVTWTNSASPLVTGTEIQYKKNSGSTYFTQTVAGKGVTKINIAGGMEMGVVYNFRARHVGGTGINSAYTAVVNHTVGGTPTTLAAVLNANATGIKTFLQNNVPTSVNAGDLWIDSDDGNKIYRATSSGNTAVASGQWVATSITAGAIGLGNVLNQAQVTTFASDNPPTSTAIGDLWMDTNDGNKVYRAESVGADQVTAGEWVSTTLTKTGIGLGNVADERQITIFRENNPPTATAVGDLWYDTNDNNRQYRASATGSSNWVEVSPNKSTVGLNNVDNKSSATILGEDHTGTSSGNHTGTVGGVANGTITTGASRAAAVINSDNRFTGEFFLDNVYISGANSRSAFERALAGLDSSGNVQRAVPAAQLNAALTTVLTASPSTTAQWVTQDGAVYSPAGTNFDITITADNGTTSETGVFRWSFVNVSNSNADYISGCTEQTDSTSSFSVSVTTDLSGNDQKFAQATVTHDSGETIVISALLSQIHVSGGGKN
jgi:hypothetical protein